MSKLPSATQRFTYFLGCTGLFLAAVKLGLLVPLYSGLLVYALVLLLAPRFARGAHLQQRARWIAASLIGALVVAALLAAGAGAWWLVRHEAGFAGLLQQMGDILGSARAWLPELLVEQLPPHEDLLSHAGDWLKEHASEVSAVSFGALKTLGYALIGLLLGAMIAIAEVTHDATPGPVSQRLLEQIVALRGAFWRVASAQVKISALNTLLTAIYLALLLPAMGVHLPFTKTLIVITFIAGLLPVVGNLISNTAITILSLSHSFPVAAGSLLFLVAMHKLEYFVNARIVGSEIGARAWEILLCMLLLERLFGPAGVVAAPVFFAWLKDEWRRWDQPATHD